MTDEVETDKKIFLKKLNFKALFHNKETEGRTVHTTTPLRNRLIRVS